MLRKKTITHLFLAIWLAMSFASCASDTASDVPVPQDEKVYLSVAIHVNGEDDASTRAEDYYFEPNPWGGEHGNGDFSGESDERKVNNLSLLFYTSDKADLTDGNARIEKVIYFPSVTQDGKRTIAVEVDPKFLNTANLRFLVIANTDDLSSYRGRTIAEVRDQLITNVFTRSNDASFTKKGVLTGFSSFVMSSHGQSSMTNKSGSGTQEDPYVIDHEIERLAARIDILPHVPRYNLDKNNLYCNYCYDVTEGSNVIGGFMLEYVRPYNVLTSQEYVFKRTAADKNLTDLTYLGLEKDVNNKSTNYVVDPTSLDKSQATFSYPKNTAEHWATATYEDFYKTRNAGKTHTNSTGSKAADPYNPETAYYILDYVKENTSFDNNEQYATGLVFKGKYFKKNDWVVATEAAKAAGESSHPKDGATGTDKAYTYVIRHSDPEGSGTKADPMYYGIVRNNVYRVRIDGVTGKGPDGLKLTINVRKWATYTHEEATM